MIGIFDSGIGGLTVFKELKQKLPKTSLVYFADTLHLPYGEKTPEEIKGFSRDITAFLLKNNINALVIACNTASALGRDAAKEMAPLLAIYDVISPTAKKTVATTKNKNVGVIGTRATILSNAYSMLIEKESQGTIKPAQKATPALVPMIEKGVIEGSFDIEIIREAIISPEFESIDTLVLGCTHYPLIKKEIRKVHEDAGKKIEVVDSSEAVCDGVITTFKEKDNEDNPQYLFFASKVTSELEEFTSRFLNESVTFTEVVV